MGSAASKQSSSSTGSAHAEAASHTPPLGFATDDDSSTKGLSSTVALGAGCFWGTDKYVSKDFQMMFPNSIKSTAVGFMNPSTEPKFQNPSYRDVCSGRTGHVEVLLVKLSNPEKHFRELMRFFFMFHDPTTKNRQGNDRGSQYASWIFCADAAQAAIAQEVLAELQAAVSAKRVRAYASSTVTTAISPLRAFTAAEDYHQRYLERNPNGYCNHRRFFKTWPKSR
jgi:peptide-methionine (S)-S-oxide reductase